MQELIDHDIHDTLQRIIELRHLRNDQNFIQL